MWDWLRSGFAGSVGSSATRGLSQKQAQAAGLIERASQRIRGILGADFEVELARLREPIVIFEVWVNALAKVLANFALNTSRALGARDRRRFIEGMLSDFAIEVRRIAKSGQAAGGLQWFGPGPPPQFQVRRTSASEEERRLMGEIDRRMWERIMRFMSSQEMVDELTNLGDAELLVKVWLGSIALTLAHAVLILKHGSPQVDTDGLVDGALKDFSAKVIHLVSAQGG